MSTMRYFEYYGILAAAHLCAKSVEVPHSDKVPDAPLARDSLGIWISLWSMYFRWLDHSSSCRVDGLSISWFSCLAA